MTTVLCVPQWQGSGLGDSPRLAAGAHRTAELVPADSRITVPVLDTGGKPDAGVRGLDVLTTNLRLTYDALTQIDDDVVITTGGDCAVDLAPIALARLRYGDRLTVLWIDAHPDLYTPQTLRSGSFHGMVLRTLLGEGPAALVPAQPLVPEQVIIAGERAGSPSEHEYLERAGIRRYGVDTFGQALDGVTGPVYLHIDLDVLEPTEFGSLGYPEPDGVRVDQLIELVSGADHVIGAAITEHMPTGQATDEADSEVIRRLTAALCSRLDHQA
ncbi:Arginase/agmatinase/formiminoglutamase [Kribbella flavida DSM 17836]|uniref:Arginase/agmatinase/formiminoglutamase n=1 Tax=Kribbella flavida (strain DSM 17836 / JCM 10339 / NBRC 14399) TaxID=479435 RepID=D2PWN0_KRIFD|nr:arginase family protein [Kribbella flavida]ADB33499.1 Arginase/agmatinase/formiminoglutamase [Kribbella flavida DSM 17836]